MSPSLSQRKRVGITGHQRLDDESAWSWVEETLIREVSISNGDLEGYSSLAGGSDQIFAEAVLSVGGKLHAIVPFSDYERTFTSRQARQKYRDLLAKATTCSVLPWIGSDEQSFYAAGKAVVDAADEILAVWNGRPAVGLGGTADIVAYAVNRGKSVIYLDPYARSVQLLSEEQIRILTT